MKLNSTSAQFILFRLNYNVHGGQEANMHSKDVKTLREDTSGCPLQMNLSGPRVQMAATSKPHTAVPRALCRVTTQQTSR